MIRGYFSKFKYIKWCKENDFNQKTINIALEVWANKCDGLPVNEYGNMSNDFKSGIDWETKHKPKRRKK